ncbi:MAG: glutamate-5-semialdehyde dehydrogenase [Elusimicrobiota bacterium]|nr:MAG: glutamate-5-semialdehyde dehydrogenase [Elusimicrobiota bacterium]
MNVRKLAEEAKAASRVLAKTPTSVKNKALRAMAAALRRSSRKVLAANARELAAVRESGRPPAFIERMTLSPNRVEAIAAALEQVARLPDPVGTTRKFARRPNGLVIDRMRVPLGVVAIIYESRPGVTADAAGLALKSGNAAILRGGKETVRTNAAIADALRAGLRKAGLPPGSVGFVNDPDRAAVRELLTLDSLIDLVIPRGGPDLTVAVRRESMIPVLAHDKGLVHVYVDDKADLAMAERIALNAKAERPGVCNAMETLLVHEKIAARFLPRMAAIYAENGVELRGDAKTRRILPGIKAATEKDWDTEYLALILSVKIVKDLDEALGHIARHGSGLAEAIVTKDAARAAKFLREADAGAVYHNASTRFTDGGEFGLGAEMGISTQKLHARGPVALEGLTCEKFVVRGRGQVRHAG